MSIKMCLKFMWHRRFVREWMVRCISWHGYGIKDRRSVEQQYSCATRWYCRMWRIKTFRNKGAILVRKPSSNASWHNRNRQSSNSSWQTWSNLVAISGKSRCGQQLSRRHENQTGCQIEKPFMEQVLSKLDLSFIPLSCTCTRQRMSDGSKNLYHSQHMW